MQITHFGLEKLALRILENENGKENHITLGAQTNFFALLQNGHARFTCDEGEIELYPGELLYIPMGLIYTSYWFGSPSCRFYSLGFSFTHERENARFALQKRSLTSLDITEDIFCCQDSWQSLSLLYRLYTAAATRFTPRAPTPYAKELGPALERLCKDPVNAIDVPGLARLCHMSESKFYYLFKKSTGCTPIDYKNKIRARLATDLLQETTLPLEEIAARLGCSSPSYLRRILMATIGKSPREIRRQKENL